MQADLLLYLFSTLLYVAGLLELGMPTGRAQLPDTRSTHAAQPGKLEFLFLFLRRVYLWLRMPNCTYYVLGKGAKIKYLIIREPNICEAV